MLIYSRCEELMSRIGPLSCDDALQDRRKGTARSHLDANLQELRSWLMSGRP